MNTHFPLRFAGLKIERRSREESFTEALELLEKGPFRVYWINTHCANIAQENPRYRQALHNGELVLNDGAGIELAGRLLSAPVVDNLNGTDWIPELFDKLPPQKLYLLGGSQENLEQATLKIAERWPHLQVVGSHHGFFDDDTSICERIAEAKPTLLLVAMGVPKQELFLHSQLQRSRSRQFQWKLERSAVDEPHQTTALALGHQDRQTKDRTEPY